MTSGISYGSTNFTILDDRSHRNTIYGDDQIVRNLSVNIGAYLKRHPNYTSTEEKKELELILGEETSSKLDQYIVTYPVKIKDPIGLSIYDSICNSYELSLEKCELLRLFIFNSPFLIVLSDEMCMAASGRPIIIHPITISLKEENITALAGEKIGILQARVQSSELKIWAVSQNAFDALERVILKFQNEQYRLANHSVTINMPNMSTPLISSRSRENFWKGCAICACLILTTAAGVGAGGYFYAKEFDMI